MASKTSAKPGLRRLGSDWVLLDDWCQSLQRRNCSPRTRSHYRRSAMKFLFWAADHGLTAATATHVDINNWLDSFVKQGPKTRYAYTSHLSCFYKWLLREEHVDRDPTLRVDRPRLASYLPRPAATERIRQALDTAQPRVAVKIALGAYAGMRRAEIATLRVEDLLLHRDQPLALVHGKGNKERLVPLHEEVVLALHRYGIPEAGFMFPSPFGGSLSLGRVGDLVSNELSTVDVHVTMHQLRHWFGTETYRLSKDIRLTQELLGHASIATTQVYTQWSRDDAQAVVARLGVGVP